MNIDDAPTVYTTDVEEVSTLTVDVKGNTLTLLLSSTANPTFTVQYYALVTRINTEPDDPSGMLTREVIDTRNGKGVPKLNQTFNMTKVYFDETSEAAAAGKAYSVFSERKLTKIYAEKTYTFAEAPGYQYNDAYKTNGGKFYLPLEITTNYINNKTGFTIELAFGDIRNAGDEPVLLFDESGNNLLKFSIDK